MLLAVLLRVQGVFAEKGARFRGKWGLGAPCPPPPNSPYTPHPWPFPHPPPLGIFSKTPTAPGRGRGVGAGGGGGAPRPHLPRKRAPFSAKTLVRVQEVLPSVLKEIGVARGSAPEGAHPIPFTGVQVLPKEYLKVIL